MYGKIFDSMYSGTLHGHWEAIVTMQQLIVLSDADGIVDMTPQAIAAITSIPLKIIQAGIKHLEQPDKHSRTEGSDGRRIETIDSHRPWGWHLINHEKYKALQDADTVRAQTRDRVRRHREERAKRPVTVGNGPLRHTDIDKDTDKKKKVEAARAKNGTRLPKSWKPSLQLQGWMNDLRPELNIETVSESFRDYWSAKAGKDATKLDWDATFRNWVRRETTPRPGSRPPAARTCSTCKKPIKGSYTGSQCDPCWKRDMGMTK